MSHSTPDLVFPSQILHPLSIIQKLSFKTHHRPSNLFLSCLKSTSKETPSSPCSNPQFTRLSIYGLGGIAKYPGPYHLTWSLSILDAFPTLGTWLYTCRLWGWQGH